MIVRPFGKKELSLWTIYQIQKTMITNKDFNAQKTMATYLEGVPYDVTRHELYSAEELYRGYSADNDDTFATCYDTLTYDHFVKTGKHGSEVLESLARALHDHGINVALDEFFKMRDNRLCIGIMGGHAVLRTDEMFRKVVFLCKRLTEEGFIMLSGGGPGAMEATHLGAWMAGRTAEEVDDALSMLLPAPSFRDKGWLSSAFAVRSKYPQQSYVSLGIPTWLYGRGIVYTPGSAGTLQEIFQDAVQNHYLTFGFASPMIFMGSRFWSEEMPVYPFLQGMMETGKYKNLLLSITDEQEEIVALLREFKNS